MANIQIILGDFKKKLKLPDVKFMPYNIKYDGFCGQIVHLKGLLR